MGVFSLSKAYALDRDLASSEVEQLYKNLQANPENVTSRRFLFEFYIKKKQWKSAVEVILPAQEKLTSTELIRLAEAQLEIADAKGALNILTFWSNKNAPTAHAKFIEGKSYALLAGKEATMEQKKAKVLLAVEAFKAAISIDPKKEDAYLQWAATIEKYLSVYAEEATLVYRKLIENNGEKEAYMINRCRYAVEARYWDEAIKVCETARSQLPESPEGAVFLSQAYMANDSKELAKKTLISAVTATPKSFLARKELADFYMKEGNPVAAVEHYTAAVGIDNTSAPAYLGQARALYQTKRYDDALVAYQKNCKLSRMVASDFKTSMGLLRSNPRLHQKYKSTIDACRK